MKNKKGFTLIELLAVIVILAIIALIATPIVINLIGKARRGAFKDSVYALMKVAETDMAIDGDFVIPQTYNVIDGEVKNSNGKL